MNTRVFVLVGGVPASGKTTHCEWFSKNFTTENREGALYVLGAGKIIWQKRNDKNLPDKYIRPLVANGVEAEENQKILIEALKTLSNKDIILDSHFVIPTMEDGFVPVPMKVFEELAPTTLHLVKASPEVVAERLFCRLHRPLWWDEDLESIRKFAELEHEHASRVSNHLNIPLHIWPGDDD